MLNTVFAFNFALNLASIFGENAAMAEQVLFATWETIYMVLLSTGLAYLFGLPLAIILVITDEGHIAENLPLNKSLGSIVNAVRSIPFIIFLILVIPLTRWIVGTSIGTVASIVPLTLAAIPFVARLVETSLKEIEWGLIEAAGLIKLKEGAGVTATPADIAENPKKLKVTMMDAAMLPRSLEDMDACVINSNYAIEAKLNPIKDSIFMEAKDSPYANVLVVRPEDKDNEAIKKLGAALQSPEVKKFLQNKYQGACVPAF